MMAKNNKLKRKKSSVVLSKDNEEQTDRQKQTSENEESSQKVSSNDRSLIKSGISDGRKAKEEKKKEPTKIKSLRLQLNDSDKENYVKWANKLLEAKDTPKVLAHEFKANKDFKPNPFTTFAFKKNPEKNRYADILCIDQTRVKLKERDEANDYIHASWMVMPEGRKYISTQGPLKDTVPDFWHMIFTENCSVIVMLCKWTEGANQKAAPYFEKRKKKDYGDYTVWITKEVELKSVRHTVLECVKKGSEKKIQVNHLWAFEWEDHIAPSDPTPIAFVHKQAIALCNDNPIVVHCSAGIGRTSTFVGIDYAMHRIRLDAEVRSLDLFRDLRKMRYSAIQSPLQVLFMYMCIFELLAQEKVIPREKIDNFGEKYRRNIKFYEDAIKKKTKQPVKDAKEVVKDAKEVKDPKDVKENE